MGRAQKISRGELYLRSTGEYLTNAGELSSSREGRQDRNSTHSTEAGRNMRLQKDMEET